jgi:hypothetical protein
MAAIAARETGIGGRLEYKGIFAMLRIRVDVNEREEPHAVAIQPDWAPAESLRVGESVVLYDPGMECEAILRHGKRWEWVADVIWQTIREVPYD